MEFSNRVFAGCLSVVVGSSCPDDGLPADVLQAAGWGCWSLGGSPASSPSADKRSSGRAASPGRISSWPWQRASRRRRGGLIRTAGRHGEEPEEDKAGRDVRRGSQRSSLSNCACAVNQWSDGFHTRAHQFKTRQGYASENWCESLKSIIGGHGVFFTDTHQNSWQEVKWHNEHTVWKMKNNLFSFCYWGFSLEAFSQVNFSVGYCWLGHFTSKSSSQKATWKHSTVILDRKTCSLETIWTAESSNRSEPRVLNVFSLLLLKPFSFKVWVEEFKVFHCTHNALLD